MQVTHQIVLLGHLVGFAALLGGVLAQARSRAPEVNPTMLWGGWASLLTGVVLVVLGRIAGPVSWWPLSVKLILTLFVVLLLTRNHRFLSVPRGLLGLIGGLVLVVTAISVLWR